VEKKIIKILPISETMQGISTSAESKEERSKIKKIKKNIINISKETLFNVYTIQ
jgi:hypothetical protein